MALDTYANLQTAVLRHAGRPGDTYLQATLPDLVTLCENRINYGSAAGQFISPALRVRDMESRVTATIDEEFEDLPTDFLEMRNLKLLTTPAIDLVYRSPQQFEAEYPRNGGTGTPVIYTLIGDQVRFGPAPDTSSYTVEMTYYAKVPALSASLTGTNWLLDKAPAVYLYGTLLELMPFIRSDDRIATWFALFTAGIGSMQGQDERARWSGGSMQMRTDTGNAP